ncbi:small heat shock protein, chloroplastic-like [Rutidosis leptorrhynchoides]|uniref:small heat shock protein, chloroplastic-like n=1 Tax=Rutidosis leptorrhynchoides TaxID=125765 RepID=UPI003A991C34
MTISLALKNGATARALLNKLFNPVCSVSAIPSVRRSFKTYSVHVSATIDEDRRREIDIFSDVFDSNSSTRSLSQIMNMMDRTINIPFVSAPREPALGARRGWDIKEDEDSLSLKFDMPGLDKHNVNISVEQNTLVIKGEATMESVEDKERRYSTTIDLPIDVFKLSEINAEMKNGVLKIVVPKLKAGEERKDVWQVEIK